MAIHSLLRIAMDLLQYMHLRVDTAVPPVAMDPQQVAMVQPAQPMAQQVMHSAQTMQFTGRLIPLCMGQSRITVDTQEVVDTPPTVVVEAMARWTNAPASLFHCSSLPSWGLPSQAPYSSLRSRLQERGREGAPFTGTTCLSWSPLVGEYSSSQT